MRDRSALDREGIVDGVGVDSGGVGSDAGSELAEVS